MAKIYLSKCYVYLSYLVLLKVVLLKVSSLIMDLIQPIMIKMKSKEKNNLKIKKHTFKSRRQPLHLQPFFLLIHTTISSCISLSANLSG